MDMHPNGPHFVVHKTDHEGTILIDRLTGQIATPVDERPDWADGLQVAMLVERSGWYQKRLGPGYEDLLKTIDGAPAISFADLEWVGHDPETGDAVTTPADTEFRQEVISTILGIDREEGTIGTEVTATGGLKVIASVQNDEDTDTRPVSPEYATALDKAALTGFGLGSDTESAEKTGTNDA